MAQGSRRNRSAQSASFFWQAVFILLPVAILAGIGIFTLKRDRAFAEQEARERANGLAEEALERLMAALGLMVQSNSAVLSHDFTAMGQEGLVMDAGGNLLSPKILEPASFAQLVDWESLSPGQRKLWREAEILEFAKGDYPEAAKLQQEFLESQPSADWSARGRYTLGLLLLKQGQTNGATEQFQLARDGSSASPTLVQHLAQLQLIHLGASGENPSVQPGRIEERILWHAAYQPSMASRDLLLAADRSGLKPSKAEYKSWPRCGRRPKPSAHSIAP